MKIGPHPPRSVVFVGTEAGGTFVPLGTGFIAVIPYKDIGFRFLVTARHVVEDAPGTTISYRINRKAGGADVLRIPKDPHVHHNNPAVDIAILGVDLGQDVYDFAVFRLVRSEYEKWIADNWEPGPGDEVSVIGLYTSHYGFDRNIPIVRIGHIAAMPQEQVKTDRGYVHGYLIELHSIAGISGSPVFINAPPTRIVGDSFQVAHRPLHNGMAVIIGHHVIETKEDEIVVPQFQQPGSEFVAASAKPPDSDLKRTGLAVAVPIELIFDIVESKTVQDILERSYQAHFKAGGYQQTSAIPSEVPPGAAQAEPAKGEPNPTHKEDFTSLLNAASKKSQPAD